MPSTELRQRIATRTRKVVVKVGTNAITDAAGRLDLAVVEEFAGQIAQLIAAGMSVTLVASGAIGAGITELDLPGRPKTLPLLQATAAVGQGQLMRVFHDAFARRGMKVAQVLLTRDLFESRSRYLHARNTLSALAKLGALAIINENDAVAVDEIKFGDNDVIAALVANMIGADLLVLLTVVDGVMKDGQAIDVIESVDEATLSLVLPQRSRLGSGGMGSKIAAAASVTQAGSAALIANAHTPNVLPRVLAGEKIGTLFVPAARKLSSRRRWIGQAARTSGKLLIDDGAVRALVERGKSLLPSGVRGVMGTFKRGATVAIIDSQGRQIARGLANFSAEQIDRIKGLKTSQIAKALGNPNLPTEVIHRNNMTLSG